MNFGKAEREAGLGRWLTEAIRSVAECKGFFREQLSRLNSERKLFGYPFWGSFLALLENIRSERLFLAHAPLVTLGAYPSVNFVDSSPYQREPFER